MISKLTVGHRFSSQAGIYTSLIQCQWVKRCKHTNIWKDRGIIFTVTVTIRGYIHNQRNMEAGTSIQYGFGVFRHFTVQNSIGIVVIKCNGIKVASADTAAASHTMLLIYMHFFCAFIKYQPVVGTFAQTAPTSAAEIVRDMRNTIGVLFRLTGTGATAHTDVFDGAAESCHLVALKMSQADKNIRIHNCTADLCFCYILAANNRDADIVCTL